MKRSVTIEGHQKNKKKKSTYSNSSSFKFVDLPSEMIGNILDYSLISDGLSLVTTCKQFHNDHYNEHLLFSPCKYMKLMANMTPYQLKLHHKAATHMKDQMRAKEIYENEKKKFKCMLKLIKKEIGKKTARELKKKLFKKVIYNKIDAQDTRREITIGECSIIHESSFESNIQSYESIDAQVWYSCKIVKDNEVYEIVDNCSWLCDSQGTCTTDDLNELLTIDHNIDSKLVLACLLMTAPLLSWSVVKNEYPTSFSSNEPPEIYFSGSITVTKQSASINDIVQQVFNWAI